MEYKWTVFTVTSIGVLMSAIDSQIIIVGLPQVARALHADVEQAIWFTQSYVFGSTVTLLFIGKITDTIGRVKIYNFGFAVYTAASLMLAVDPLHGPAGAWWLLGFRLVQGLGGAFLFANAVLVELKKAD